MLANLLGKTSMVFGIFPSAEELFDAMETFLYKILITIDAIIYNLINVCYQVFLALSKARIFSDELFGGFIKRFYVLVGVLMLFFIVYTLLKIIANPDDLTKGNSAPAKIIGNVLTSIALIALLPTIFNYLYQIQGVLLDNDVVGRIVIGGSSADSIQGSVKKGGRQIAVGVFSAFFYPENNKDDSEITSAEDYYGTTYTLAGAKEAFVEDKVPFTVFKVFAKNAAKDEIHYSWFISAIAGGFCLYVVVSFVFDLGIRAVKLAILQIIAPIPVLLRVIPGKDKSFNSWVSTTASTFFEVFVRVFVIYLIALIAGQIGTIMSSMFSSVQEVSGPVKAMSMAFLLMGVIAFAKQAPKMISDILGIKAGDMKLGIRDKLKEGGGFVAAGAVGAGVTTGVRNGVNTIRNIKNADTKRGKASAAVRGLGSTVGGTIAGGVRGAVGASSAKTYGEIAAKTGKAVQTTIEKREQRESYRQEHGDSTLGTIKGHAQDTVHSVATWATGDTTEALQTKRNKVSSVQSAYNDVFSEIKKDVLENEDKYVTKDSKGRNRLLSHLHQEMEQANNAVTTFDKQAYAKELIKNGKASNQVDAEKMADAESKRLMSKQFEAQKEYNKALDDTIETQNKFERGAISEGVKFKNDEIIVNQDGTVTVNVSRKDAGHVNNVDVKINAADQAIQTNRAEILKKAKELNQSDKNIISDDDLRVIEKALNNPTATIDKKTRNAIGNIVNDMDIEIAKRRQQEKKDKK